MIRFKDYILQPKELYSLLSNWVKGDWWTTKFGQYICERKGHKDIIFFNIGGTSPDTRCKRCYKDIG
jgi:hypothetical protein